MNRLMVAAGAVAAVALVAVIGIGLVAGGGLFGPGPGFGSGSGVAYASERHGYSLRIPNEWSVNELPGTWSPGSVFSYLGPGSDQFVDPADPSIVRFMNSQATPAGTTFEQWVAQYHAIHDPFFNNCRDLSDEQADLAGEPAVVLTSDCTGTFDGPGDAAGILVMHDGRGYMFRLISDGTPDEKALLLDWLSTLQFTEAAGAP